MTKLSNQIWENDICKLPAGAVLFQRAGVFDHVYHLESGTVALGISDGRRLAQQIGTFKAPCWINATCTLLGVTPLVDAIAQTPCLITRVKTDTFQQEIKSLPPSAQIVMHDLATAHRQQTELATSRLVKDAQSRCASWLLSKAFFPESDRPIINLKERKCKVAAELGMTPETFSRILKNMRDKGIISGKGKTLFLENVPFLRELDS